MQTNFKTNTHLVVKRQDIGRYLTEEEMRIMDILLEKIELGRKKDGKSTNNEYYVCNVDEPYAETVLGVIVGGELGKDIKGMVEKYEAE